ncbi:uncharacterized protein PRCAT00001698001 [Priceomyces carsonii]|uniref:uncharacterized protein n=1 Tax=Priceomyces carsonii TaxID=28549 RepID=UPI002ED7FBFF|nr:unnamed protein product [Priceomyces carsonii]
MSSYNNYRYRSYHGGYSEYKNKAHQRYHGSSSFRDRSGPKGSIGNSRTASYRSDDHFNFNNSHSNGNESPLSSEKVINSSHKSANEDKAGAIKAVVGTDPKTGENKADQKFTKLMHNSDFQSNSEFSLPTDEKKNYIVLYDPELDKSILKEERKSRQKKIRFAGLGIASLEVTDPRKLTTYFSKPNKRSKKYPFKQLPQTKFTFDEDSLGPPPRTQLVVWDLPSSASEIYLTNFIKSYGNPIRELKFINDPENAVPLGIAVFKFQGGPDKAMRLAEKFISTIKIEKPKIDGMEFKIGLNDNEGKLLLGREEVAKSKLRAAKIKREEELKKHRKQMELKELKKKTDLNKKEELKKPVSKITQPPNASKYLPNSTVLSVRKNNRIINGVFLPKELKKFIRSYPYILIQNKYVSTKRTSTQDIKRALNKYDWIKVLSDFTGFYIVFGSLKECERCFFNEDGRKFFEYRMFMEFAIPEGCNMLMLLTSQGEDDGARTPRWKAHDVVNEAANMLLKDFETFLAKDIRERVIAPAILDLLSHDKYPALVKELKEKEAAKEATKVATKPIDTNALSKKGSIPLYSLKRDQTALLPSFKKKQDHLKSLTSGSRSRPTRSMIPLQHALNFDSESEESEDDESTRSLTPIAPSLKRNRSSTVTSNEEDFEHEDVKRRKKTSLQQSLMYDSSTDEDDIDKEEDTSDKKANVLDEEDLHISGKIYQPTYAGPEPVFEEPYLPPSTAFDLDFMQEIIKDHEDLEIAAKVLEDVKEETEIENIEYFSWKQKNEKADWQEIAEDVDLIEELDPRLESKSGSFRSDGYKKISEVDKIAYLPLRRRKVQKPIKTVQHDDEESSANNNIQSSRVNRANNRRFAADITAQLGNETEVLSLNTLTKRKKPVSFARSAIHNWGLYALEPIAAKEMIIEYVGESIRQQVAENREHSYMKTGIGSSYLFRIDENTVIDATKKGGIARFINHCCNPSCTAKIIKVEGKKRIVIYALKDVEANEELTYDYKFERETNDEERIRCLCGAPGCKGYLN